MAAVAAATGFGLVGSARAADTYTLCSTGPGKPVVSPDSSGRCGAGGRALVLARGSALRSLEREVRALQTLLAGVTRSHHTMRFSGMNLQLVSGSGSTSGRVNGLGNLIIGYDENPHHNPQNGSMNLVLGEDQTFTSYGGVIGGEHNALTGSFADVFALDNTASARFSSVTGGSQNRATFDSSAVSGGEHNTASGDSSSVSGGEYDTATVDDASVSGGENNTASGISSSVSGGADNIASTSCVCIAASSVSGGNYNVASGFRSWVSGGRENYATGQGSAVSGGDYNTSSALNASISGGRGNSADALYASVSGGFDNTAGARGASVSGGEHGLANALDSSISGGCGNLTGRGTTTDCSGFIDAQSILGGFNKQVTAAGGTSYTGP